MLEKNTVNKKVGSRITLLPKNELLRERIAYLFTATFLLSAITIITSAIWLHEFRLALVAFVFLAFIAQTIVAALFGQRKTADMLYEIIRYVLGKTLGK